MAKLKTLYEVYSDPEFQNLSFDQQQYVKDRWLNDTIQARPDLQRLAQEDPATFNDLTSKLMKTAPAMRGYNPLDITDEERAQADAGVVLGERGAWIKGVRLYERLQENPDDQKTLTEARLFAASNAAANESFFYKIADAGLDFLEDTFGMKRGSVSRLGSMISPALGVLETVMPGSFTRGEALSDRDDLTRLTAAMDATAGRGRDQAIGAVKDVVGFGTGFAETIAITAATFGSGGIVAVGGKAAGGAVVGTPGIFTRGLFGATGAFTKLASKATTAAGAAVWKYGAPAVAEAVGGGLVDSFRAIPDLLKDESVQGDKNFWTGFAGTFGRGVAYDLAFNMLGGVVKTAAKPFVRVFRKMNITTTGGLDAVEASAKDLDFVSKPENLKAIAQTVLGNVDTLPKGVENLSPEVLQEIYKRQAQGVVWAQMKGFEMTDPKTLSPLARAVADLDFEDLGNGAFKLTRGEFSKTVQGPKEALFEIFAQGQARTNTSMLDEIYEEVSEGLKIASPIGGNPGARIRSMARVRRADVKNLGTETLLAQIPLAQGGEQIFETQAKGVAQQFLKRAKVTNTEQIVALMPQNLVRPGQFQTAADELRYFDNLEGWLKQVAGPQAGSIPSLRSAFLADPARNLSLNGLDAAARKMLPNGRVESIGQNRFRVTFQEPGQTPVEEVIVGLRNTNDWLGKKALEGGLVSEADVADQFYKQTGMRIEWQEEVKDSFGKKLLRPLTNTEGMPVYRIRRPNGEIQGGDMTSMAEAVGSQPGFSFKLPDSLTPDFMFDAKGTVWKSQTLLAAPMNKIRQIMDGFMPSKGLKVDIHWDEMVNGKQVKISSSGTVGMFEVEIPSLGFKRGFATQKAANEFIAKKADSFDLLQTLAHERGYKVEFSPSGSAFVRDINSSQVFPMRSQADLEDFIAKAPDPSVFAKKLFGIEDEADPNGAFTASLMKILHETPVEAKPIGDIVLEDMGASAKALSDKDVINYMVSPAKQLGFEVQRVAGPRHDALRAMADAYNVPEVVKHIDQIQMLSGIVSKQSTKAQQWIKAIASPGGKAVTRLDRSIAKTLTQNAPENWDKVLANVSKSIKNWTPEDSLRVKGLASRTVSFFNAWGKVFGVDGYDFLQHYLPKLQNIRSVVAEIGTGDEKTGAVLARIFGGASEGVRPIQFFAKHGRLNDLVQLGESDDVVTLMSTYVEMGLREKYLGVGIDNLDKFLKEGEGKLPDVLSNTLRGFRDLARGGVLSGNEKAAQRVSLLISGKISEGLRRLKPFFGNTKAAESWDLYAKDLVTSNIPGKASNLVSFATLGGRPWRGLSNTMQFHLNVMPIYGQTAYTAQGMVDPAYITKCFNDGLLAEKMLASDELSKPITSKIAELAMRPQQNSEYLVRAWTAKTAELQYREALDKLTKGVIDEPEFIQYSKAYLMGKTDQAAFLDLVRKGNYDGAQWKLQRFVIDETMFNYEKSNRPEIMKGVVGTAFGKFMVFPIGQFNLYNKVLNSGSIGQRAVTMARFAAMSAIVYNAFRAAGVDYSGFRMTDPFSFSGGPLFTSGMDLLQAKKLLADKEDPQAQQAWGRFLKNWSFVSSSGGFNVPRLAVPGYLQMRDMTNGAAMFEEGQMYGGFLKMLGAPVSADILEGGFQASF